MVGVRDRWIYGYMDAVWSLPASSGVEGHRLDIQPQLSVVRDVLGKTEKMELSLTLAEERALERVGTGKGGKGHTEWHG